MPERLIEFRKDFFKLFLFSKLASCVAETFVCSRFRVHGVGNKFAKHHYLNGFHGPDVDRSIFWGSFSWIGLSIDVDNPCKGNLVDLVDSK